MPLCGGFEGDGFVADGEVLGEDFGVGFGMVGGEKREGRETPRTS